MFSASSRETAETLLWAHSQHNFPPSRGLTQYRTASDLVQGNGSTICYMLNTNRALYTICILYIEQVSGLTNSEHPSIAGIGLELNVSEMGPQPQQIALLTQTKGSPAQSSRAWALLAFGAFV